jgi:hypothetical protein
MRYRLKSLPETETAPALSPLEILDAVYRLPAEWREKYWQLFDAVGRCSIGRAVMASVLPVENRDGKSGHTGYRDRAAH